MGKLKAKLTDYKNFWLIWLSCAGQEKGISLFRIQTLWGIQTNYLYHKEAGLGRPIVRIMEDQGYVSMIGNRINPRFEWIPQFIASQFQSDKPAGGFWSPELVMKGRWPQVQEFMQFQRKHFFDHDNLRILYRGEKDVLGIFGRYVFQHVFLYVMFSNLIAFSKRYHAEIVAKMISTSVSLGSGADVLSYMYQLHSQIGGSKEFPVLAKDEQDLARMLCSLKW